MFPCIEEFAPNRHLFLKAHKLCTGKKRWLATFLPVFILVTPLSSSDRNVNLTL
jgi:hypothetical protein